MARKRRGSPVHGWVLLDKPLHMTSTRAVAIIKRLFNAQKAGHAGTLDPLASGLLPVALGEATKTVPFVMDGAKAYEFTVRWGEQRSSDDGEGEVTGTSAKRPERKEVEALLASFTGTIMQTPPAFSAIRLDGARAYDLARAGKTVKIAARPVIIDKLELTGWPDRDHAVFRVACGKGTYVRALARDMGLALGCLGYVSALARTKVGCFGAHQMIPLAMLEELRHKGADGLKAIKPHLHPLETALDDIPALAVSNEDATRLRQGQPVMLKGRDAPVFAGRLLATAAHQPVAICSYDKGMIRPERVFKL